VLIQNEAQVSDKLPMPVVFGLLLSLILTGIGSNARAAWDSQSETAFIDLMCGGDSYFRKCFDLKADECRTDLKKSVKECRLKIETVKKVRGTKRSLADRPLSPDEDVELHSKIGLCAGIKVEKRWSDRKSASNECRKRENWQ
jgi:hypothetical protein